MHVQEAGGFFDVEHAVPLATAIDGQGAGRWLLNGGIVQLAHGTHLFGGVVPEEDKLETVAPKHCPDCYRNNFRANRLFDEERASCCALPVGKVGNRPRQGPRPDYLACLAARLFKLLAARVSSILGSFRKK